MFTVRDVEHFLWCWELDHFDVVKIHESLTFLLEKINSDYDDQVQQYWAYEAAKLHYPEYIREIFQIVYLAMLGERQGPRMGAFINLLGVEVFTEKLIRGIKNPIQSWDKGRFLG